MITYAALDFLGSRKIYHGSTNNPERRVEQHLNSTDNYPFQNALKQRQFYWIFSTNDDLQDRSEEQFYIDFYFGTPWSFNLNPNVSDPPRPPETLPNYWVEAIRESRKGYTGNNPEAYVKGWETRRKNGNDKASPETRSKMKDSHTGRKHSKKSRDKRSEKLKGVSTSAKGSTWYVNESSGKTKMFHEPPGKGWRKGRKL